MCSSDYSSAVLKDFDAGDVYFSTLDGSTVLFASNVREKDDQSQFLPKTKPMFGILDLDSDYPLIFLNSYPPCKLASCPVESSFTVTNAIKMSESTGIVLFSETNMVSPAITFADISLPKVTEIE